MDLDQNGTGFLDGTPSHWLVHFCFEILTQLTHTHVEMYFQE